MKIIYIDMDDFLYNYHIVIAEYNILSLFQRQNIDPKSFRHFFRQCYRALTNIVDERKRTFLSILKSDSKFNPQNTPCILKVKFFIFLKLSKKFSFSANH